LKEGFSFGEYQRSNSMKAKLIDLTVCKECYNCQISCPNEAARPLVAGSLEEYENDPAYVVIKTRAGLQARVFLKGTPTRIISGSVYDFSKNEALAGAKITLVNEYTSKRRERETDPDGVFWFMDVDENANYSIGITYVGRKMAIADILTDDDINLGDIAFE